MYDTIIIKELNGWGGSVATGVDWYSKPIMESVGRIMTGLHCQHGFYSAFISVVSIKQEIVSTLETIFMARKVSKKSLSRILLS